MKNAHTSQSARDSYQSVLILQPKIFTFSFLQWLQGDQRATQGVLTPCTDWCMYDHSKETCNNVKKQYRLPNKY